MESGNVPNGGIPEHGSPTGNSLQLLIIPISQEEETDHVFQNLLTDETSLRDGVNNNLDEEIVAETSTKRGTTTMTEDTLTTVDDIVDMVEDITVVETTAIPPSYREQYQESGSPDTVEIHPRPGRTSANPVPQCEGLVPMLPAGPQMPKCPVRHGEPDCEHYMRTGTWPYRSACRFNHPLTRQASSDSEENVNSGAEEQNSGNQTESDFVFPQRPGKPKCRYYMRMGKCRFGVKCYFDHPQGLPSPEEMQLQFEEEKKDRMPCEHLLRTGTCAYGKQCCFRHSSVCSVVRHEAPNGDTLPSPDNSATSLPTRPGKPSCHFYMRTGKCAFGKRCKWNHPTRGTSSYAVACRASNVITSPIIPHFLSMIPMVRPLFPEPEISPSPNEMNVIYVPEPHFPYDLPASYSYPAEHFAA